jgi:uncharacterized protein (DUF362 family)
MQKVLITGGANMAHTDQPNENPIVALVRSHRKEASDITESEVREMVRNAVELTGGFTDTIEDGQCVVIKPNLVSTRATTGTIGALSMPFTDPYKKNQVPQTANGFTADWRIAKALVELVREVNPSGKVYVMESSGEGQVSKTFEIMGYTHENIPGVDRFIGLDETGDGYRAVDSPDFVAVDLKEKQRHKSLPAFLKNKYYFDKTYFSANVVISLCCLKNHAMAAVTGGIKNVAIGTMPGKIYGNTKTKINRAMTINHGWESLNNYIHNSYICKPVQFVLTDGLQGSAYGPHGQGAPSYEAAKMNMRLVLASKDPVAVDAVHACIVGVDPEKVDYLKYISQEGLGTLNTSKISIVGNARVDEVRKPFPMAKGLVRHLWSMPSKTQYIDFRAPELSIEEVTLKGIVLDARVHIDPNVAKIEVHINGRLVRTFREGLDHIQCSLDEPLEGVQDITFRAYDRLLNCACRTVRCNQSEHQEQVTSTGAVSFFQ